MKTADKPVEALLPLPLVTFHILMALTEGERHGYAIIQEVSDRTGKDLSAGTLYRSIHRMQEQELVVEVRPKRVALKDDPRRKYYRLTPFGRDVALAEAKRLEQLVELARSSGLSTAGA